MSNSSNIRSWRSHSEDLLFCRPPAVNRRVSSRSLLSKKIPPRIPMSEKQGVFNNMNRYFTGTALALCLVTAVSAQEAKEQKLKFKDVPAPVVAAAAKAYPN